MKEDFEHPKMYLYRRIVEAKLFIDTNYHRKIDLDQISDQAHFSKFHFLRLFKQSVGKSPHQYLIERRVEEAKKLLQQNLALAEVCHLLGFDSVPSFIHLFKRKVSMTPKAFQEKHREEELQKKESPRSFVPNCFASNFDWSK